MTDAVIIFRICFMYGCLVVGHLDAGNVVFVDYMIWTLHCSQCYRDLLGMNPAAGSKGYKGKKRGVSICPRVMTLFRKLAAFHRRWWRCAAACAFRRWRSAAGRRRYASAESERRRCARRSDVRSTNGPRTLCCFVLKIYVVQFNRTHRYRSSWGHVCNSTRQPSEHCPA